MNKLKMSSKTVLIATVIILIPLIVITVSQKSNVVEESTGFLLKLFTSNFPKDGYLYVIKIGQTEGPWPPWGVEKRSLKAENGLLKGLVRYEIGDKIKFVYVELPETQSSIEIESNILKLKQLITTEGILTEVVFEVNIHYMQDHLDARECLE